MHVSPPFTVLVKPAGADCNLNCGYCFYLRKNGLYPGDTPPRMSLATAEAMIRAYFSVPLQVYSFAWQGGEPTLMGVDFYREVFAMQQRLLPPGAQVTNAFQTNGTLLTPEWAGLFRDHGVLVGVSIDGPAAYHDLQRRWADREGAAISGARGDTHHRVEQAIELLRSEGVSFNALTVVGRHNEDAPGEIYDYLRRLKIRHMQFIPLVEWGDSATFSVTPAGWGRFLNGIFDRWFPKEVRRVSIRHFDTVMELLVHGRYNVCTISGACGGHFVVEHAGDIYPCDFFVDPELRLGNVASVDSGGSSRGISPFEVARQDRRHHRFVERKALWNEGCDSCEYLWLCSGDCPKMRPPRDLLTARGVDGVSALCEGWRIFYDHTLPHFERLARSVAPGITGHAPAIPEMIDSWDHEAPCFCGSGRPAGSCHLKNGHPSG